MLNLNILDLPPLVLNSPSVSWPECRADVRECTFKPGGDKVRQIRAFIWPVMAGQAGVLLLSGAGLGGSGLRVRSALWPPDEGLRCRDGC